MGHREPVILKSDRGLPLVMTYIPTRPVLTLENYCKWYCLYLVHPDGRVEQWRPDDEGWDGDDGIAWGDHVPNPAYLIWAQKAYDIPMDSQSFELAVGRWVLEAEDRDFSSTAQTDNKV